VLDTCMRLCQPHMTRSAALPCNASYILLLLQYNVDRSAICCSGFSDGASYALSLGLSNGDLFSHILAFSPGFMRPMSYQGGRRG
jgi:predicted esterase